MGDLKGKVALITGATSGIGLEIARRFAADGASVVLSGRREDLLDKAQAEITAQGGQCKYLAGDGVVPLFASKLVDFAKKQWGRLDILVCSAGIALRTPTLTMPLGEWNNVLQVNLTYPMMLAQACIPLFLENGGGKIVLISSTAAKSVNLGASPSYGASKAGLVYLTRHLASEFGRQGVYVNAVCPGPVDTEITQSWTIEHRQKVLADLPLGRMATPADVAECAYFLASSMSDYINGESIMVNGGRFMD